MTSFVQMTTDELLDYISEAYPYPAVKELTRRLKGDKEFYKPLWTGHVKSPYTVQITAEPAEDGIVFKARLVKVE